jgi:uncharacterized protein
LDRVFLDANVLFSAAYASGAGLQRLWKLSEIELVTSHYAVAEARRNLERPTQKARLTRLMRAVSLVVEPDDISLPNDIELPAKDQPILASAIAAKSTHLLTGDVKHFGRYYRQLIADVLILAPAEYLESRAADSS